MTPSRHDLAIVGAGPAGLAAALQARVLGLDAVVLDRAPHAADTVVRYARRKPVMSEPALVPLRAELPFAAGSRETVLESWQRATADLRLELGAAVTAIAPGGSGFEVRTTRSVYEVSKVVVAIGTRGNPRRLEVPGEDLPHVADRLVDPDQHRDEDVVVVGGGDSALETAIALSAHNRVSLVVRRPELLGVKESLERELSARRAAGRLAVHFSTVVRAIEPGVVVLQGPEGELRRVARRVFPALGAEPPRALLEGWGIAFFGEGREARPVTHIAGESSVPGLYLVGAVAGRDLIKLAINQAHEVVAHIAGHAVEPADEALLGERLPWWAGSVADRLATIRDEMPVFAGASDETLRQAFLHVRCRSADDGEVLLRQNDYSDDFVVVASGRVAIRRREAGGEETVLATLEPGSFFGEMGLLSGRRRNATAVAGGAARVLVLPRKAMLELLRRTPPARRLVDRAFMVRALGGLFRGAPEGSLWPLACKAGTRTVAKGETIFQEGDRGTALFLVRSGMVQLTRRVGDRDVVLTYLDAGNAFGETSLLEDRPRSASVRAIFPTELIVLEKRDFLDFLAQHPELRPVFLERLAAHQDANRAAERSPGASEILSRWIESEAVIGTDVLVIDNHKCLRCGECVAACESVHADGQARLSLTGDTVANLLLPNSCMQCQDPLCMLDCPPDAIVRLGGGEVHIRDTCIGCGNCADNCPYDNIFMVVPKRRSGPFDWLTGLLGAAKEDALPAEVAVKCDLCADVGGGPACVRSCPTGAAIRLAPTDAGDLRRLAEELAGVAG